jgi:A/G-specific adenine glycosylase
VRPGCQAHAQGRTAQLPAPRPKRQRPLRHAQLLLVEGEGGRLLFERRPPAGIWGGLWCLPIAEAHEDPAGLLLQRYGLQAKPGRTLPAISHGFTHFELQLTPLRLHVERPPTAIHERQDLRWLPLTIPDLPGLPAPVVKLLRQLQQQPELPL